MKKHFAKKTLKGLWLAPLIIVVAISCKNYSGYMTVKQSLRVKDSVTWLTTSIAKDLSAKGPASWLNYFENAPGFFMATDGQLAFKDYQSSKEFILNTLAKNISKISLQWTNLRVEPLTINLASIGSGFHEDLTGTDGKIISVDGYFTATASLENDGWKLRNLHWSTKPQTGSVTK